MAIVWPPELPSGPQLNWQEEKLENAVRSETDSGPAKKRRRFTRAVRRVSLPLVLTEAQVSTLDTFHTDTLGDGVLRFEMTHPRTGLTHEFRFIEPPRWVEQARGFYLTTLELEYQL